MDWDYKEKKKEYDKKYREKNKDKIKEYEKEYRKNHKEERKEYNEKNKDRIREQRKEYRERNKDKIKENRIYLYNAVIEKICSYYNVDRISFFDGTPLPLRNKKKTKKN